LSINVIVHNINQDIFIDNGDIIQGLPKVLKLLNNFCKNENIKNR